MTSVPPPSVPVMRPLLPSAASLLPRLKEMDAARWYSNFGPQERQLRERFAEFLDVDADHVATASSGSLALQGALATSPARRWVVPAFTFAATPMAVVSLRRTLEFADVSSHDWWMNATMGDRDEETGLLPVAPFGGPVQLDRWQPEREVVIDAAASLGTALPPLRQLPPTWAIMFSLHATKCLAAGEGGLIVFGDPQRAERFRTWSNHGIASAAEAGSVGTNAKLSELAAVCAHASLDDWPAIKEQWLAARAAVERLQREFDLQGQPGPPVDVSPYWTVVAPDAARAERFSAALARAGVETRRWWGSGCHTMRAFPADPTGTGPENSFPVTEDLATRTIGLPMFRDLDDRHLELLRSGLAAARAALDV